MLRVSFVMEQHLGHQTYYQNLRRFIEDTPQIQANWVPITYYKPCGAIESFGFLPTHLRGTLRGRQQVRSGLRSTDADVAFFNTQVPAALGGALVRRQPYIIATDLTPIQYDAMGLLYGHAPDKPGVVKAYKHRINCSLFRGATRLLPWSSWARDSLVHDYGVDAAKVDVLPPGVDLALWRPADVRGDGPFRILFVGGDFERKGGALLLRAFQTLPPGTAELHIVTRTTLASTPGVFVHNGMQPNTQELISLYQRCNVFVLPTGAEAFGIAAVEALATGLPVIAARVGGLVDVVAEAETGYLVSPNDERALAMRLRELAFDIDLRARMGRAARKRAEVYFSAQHNAARLLDCLVKYTEN